MAVYKGIEIDDALTGSMRHMQGVEDYREVPGKLQAAWDTLALLSQLTGAATEMTGTREAFERLTGDLLNRLGQETRRKAIAELRSKAQTSIDILGLLVDELGEIPEISRDEIKAVNHMGAAGDALTVGIVEGMRRSEDRHGLLSILASDRLCHRIGCHCETPEAPRTIERARPA